MDIASAGSTAPPTVEAAAVAAREASIARRPWPSAASIAACSVLCRCAFCFARRTAFGHGHDSGPRQPGQFSMCSTSDPEPDPAVAAALTRTPPPPTRRRTISRPRPVFTTDADAVLLIPIAVAIVLTTTAPCYPLFVARNDVSARAAWKKTP